MNIIIIIFIAFLIYKILKNQSSGSVKNNLNKENYKTLNKENENTNLGALSRDELQTATNIDLSKIDWTKIDDYTYSQVICLIQGCDERPIINNLPIFTSS